MKRFLRKLHLWLSIPVGLIIVCICFSGACLLLQRMLTPVIFHSLYYVEDTKKNTLPVSQLAEKVKATLPDSVQIQGITAYADPQRTWKVNLTKPYGAGIFINPHTGEILGNNPTPDFFQTMFQLHTALLDNATEGGEASVGERVIGVTTLFMAIVLLSGIVIWIPKTRRLLKARTRISFRRGAKRFNYDLHVSGGIYAVLVLLAMALTGLNWSFDWYKQGLYNAFGADVPAYSQSQEASQQATFTAWDTAYAQLVSASKEEIKEITLNEDGTAVVTHPGLGNPHTGDQYQFDIQSGKITKATLYKDLPVGERMGGIVHTIHVGDWGGWFSDILYLMAVLLGATLPLTGYYLWIKSLSHKRR